VAALHEARHENRRNAMQHFQRTLGFSSCCVRVGRGLYAGGFLHSYVQWPACRHRWQTVDADALAGPRACVVGTKRTVSRRRTSWPHGLKGGGEPANNLRLHQGGSKALFGVTPHTTARPLEASKQIAQRAF